MLEARKKEQEQQQQQQPQQQQQGKPAAASTSSPSSPPRVERVVLTTEDVMELLNMVDQDDEYLSDASDVLFSIQSDTISAAGAGELLGRLTLDVSKMHASCVEGPSFLKSAANEGLHENSAIVWATGLYVPNGLMQRRRYVQDEAGAAGRGASLASRQQESVRRQSYLKAALRCPMFNCRCNRSNSSSKCTCCSSSCCQGSPESQSQ